jgi:hypothetical protein
MEVIRGWELSGNSFGQQVVEDDEFGHLTKENFMDDNHSSEPRPRAVESLKDS